MINLGKVTAPLLHEILMDGQNTSRICRIEIILIMDGGAGFVVVSAGVNETEIKIYPIMLCRVRQ